MHRIFKPYITIQIFKLIIVIFSLIHVRISFTDYYFMHSYIISQGFKIRKISITNIIKKTTINK